MADVKGLTQRVKRIIVQALQLDIAPDAIDEDELLFGAGLGAESVAALEVVFALEEEFGIEVDDEELQIELFDSVRAITAYVALKLEGRSVQEMPVDSRVGAGV
tara:strand:+ start:759 stop:1070 length:312 start_codon:yes stop_codon:yes gene_type:complete